MSATAGTLEQQLEQTRHALQASEQRFRNIIERNADGILVVDREGVVCFVNRAAELLLARSGDELIGSLFGFPIVAGQITEIDLLRPDGHIAVAEMHVSESEWEGRPVYLATLRDSTTRHQIEAEIRFQAQLLEAVEQAVIATDMTGRVIYWNNYAERLYGWAASEALGRNITQLIPAQGSEAHAGEIMIRLKQGAGWTGEFSVQRKDETTFVALATNSPVYQDENLVGIICVSWDITERKRAEAALAWEAGVNEAVADLSRALITASVSMDDIALLVLDYAKRLTGSQFGFVGYIEPQTGNLICPTMTRDIWKDCQIPDKSFVFETFGGLWGWVLENRQPLLTNAPEKDPRSTGVPEGHLPVRRFLSAPALAHGELMGQIALANADDDYTGQDLAVLERLASLYALAIQRRRTEESLQEANEQISNLLNSISDGFFALNHDLVVTYFNKAAEQILSLQSQEVTGRPLFEVFPELKGSIFEEKFSQAIREEKTLFFETHFKATPYENWYDVRVYPYRDGISVFFRVITGRKQAEEKIRRRNRELALLNHIIAASAAGLEPEAVLEVACRELALAFDVPRAVVSLLNNEKTEAVTVAEHRAEGCPAALGQTIPVAGNPAFQHLLAHKIPLAVEDALHDSRLVPIHNLMHQRGTISLLILPLIIEEEIIGCLDLDAIEPRHFSSEEVALAWSVAGQVAGALARMRLVKEHRQLEQQYHQSQKMEAIGQLAGGVAHDFNNLLTAMMGYAELALRSLSPGDPVRSDLEGIQQNAERAASLTRQLLAFARKQIIHPVALDPNELILNMNKMLGRLIKESIELVTLLAPDLGWIKADPGQLEQVLLNLVVNAHDAMPNGGKLIIETTNVTLDHDYASRHAEVIPGEYIMLAVSDNGIGMTEEVKVRIFEPFFTTKEMGKGSGLGLATVFGIVKQNGGHIQVYSEPGRGSTFKVYLPRIEQAGKEWLEQHKSGDLPHGRETVLLVEDEPAVRSLASRVLRRQGYTVLEAANGMEALNLAQAYKGDIQLLLTDVVMPQMDGRTLTKRLTAIRPHIKVLHTSGYTHDAAVQQEMLDSATMFLQKPFSPKTLARKVREVLDIPVRT